MRSLFIPQIAQLLLKNHQQMSDMLAAMQAPDFTSSPLSFNFESSGLNARLNMAPSEKQFTFSIQELDRHFLVTIPLDLSKETDLEVSVSWKEQGDAEPKTLKIPFKNFLDWTPPSEFAQIYARVVSYLKMALPATFFNKNSSAATEQLNAEPETGATRSNAAEARSQPEAGKDEPEYRTYVIQRDNESNLRFTGRILASSASYPRNGRQFVCWVAQTKGGKYVAVRQGLSIWLGERDKTEVKVFEELNQVTQFFGFSNLAKSLYQQLGIAAEENID